MKRSISYQFPGFNIYRDPDTGGGGSGTPPSSASGESAGGDGGGDGDLLTLAAPDIDVAAAFASGKSEAPPEPGKKDAPKPAPKPPAKPGAPPEPKSGEPPAAQLRKELEATKAELASLKTRIEAGDPRVKDLEAAVKAKEAELGSEKTRAEQYRERLLLMDPSVAEELVTLDSGYNKKAGSFYRSVTEIGQPQVNALVEEFARLPHGKAEYGAARQQWEAKVNEALGATDGAEHRKLERAIAFIEETYDFAVDRGQAERKVRAEASTREFEGSVKGYSTKAIRVDDLIKRAGEVTPDMETSNPLHPDVVLKNFLSVLTEEQQAKMKQGIPEFIRLAIAGLKPRSQADYAGLSPDQIAESRATETARAQTAQDHAVRVIHQGALALRVMPSMWKEIQRLRAKVKEDADGAPPDPSGNGGDSQGGGDEMTELKNLRAPDVSKLSF